MFEFSRKLNLMKNGAIFVDCFHTKFNFPRLKFRKLSRLGNWNFKTIKKKNSPKSLLHVASAVCHAKIGFVCNVKFVKNLTNFCCNWVTGVGALHSSQSKNITASFQSEWIDPVTCDTDEALAIALCWLTSSVLVSISRAVKSTEWIL